jgi:hypothetical protein
MRYMLWPGIKYTMYSFQSKSDTILFIPRCVKSRLYISFTIKFNRNESPVEKNVIHDLKMSYMLWPGIKYTMYSFQSKSDSIIFIPRRIKARIYIYSSQLSSIGTNPPAKKPCYSWSQNALYAVARNKVPYVFIPIIVWFDNIYSPTFWS